MRKSIKIQRCWFGSNHGLSFVLVAVAMQAMGTLIGTPGALAQSSEVRATWLTTTGPDHISSGRNTEAIMGQLKNIGINTVYAEAWKNGYTQFGSSTLQNLIGLDRTPSLGTRDLLQETGINAHRNGQVHMAWFEYGFSPQFLGNGGTPSNPLATYARDQGWLLQDRQGQYANANNGFAWMNPAIPEVRQLLIGITLDAIRTHDLDGIQFDDRLAWPRDFGWDATTAGLYQQETGRSLPTSVDNADFRAWRQSKVTQFAVELNQAVRAERPDIQLSVSPSVAGFSDINYNAEWSKWVGMGLFDEYVPQVYRSDLASFRSTLPSNVAPFVNSDRLDDLIVGLRYNGTGADTTNSVLQQQIIDVALAQQGQLAGHAVFYSKGLIDNAAAMTSFYGNQRDNPFFGPDWRPASLIAALVSGEWQVSVADGEQYRVIAKINGRWEEIQTDYFNPGIFAFTVAGATDVELLLDRRPIPGDTNFDRIVGDADLITLDQSYGLAGGLQQGDFNYDGLVDNQDLQRLAAFWRSGIDPGSFESLDDAIRRLGLTNIPEPGSLAAVLLIGGIVFAGRRR